MVEQAESLTRPDMGDVIPVMVLGDDRRHFLMADVVNATENWVFSQVILMMPPPDGLLSIAIVS
jgi:hypothetical protein